MSEKARKREKKRKKREIARKRDKNRKKRKTERKRAKKGKKERKREKISKRGKETNRVRKTERREKKRNYFIRFIHSIPIEFYSRNIFQAVVSRRKSPIPRMKHRREPGRNLSHGNKNYI